MNREHILSLSSVEFAPITVKFNKIIGNIMVKTVDPDHMLRSRSLMFFLVPFLIKQAMH